MLRRAQKSFGLYRQDVPSRQKVAWLIGGGLVALALGYAWSFQFPIIKKIWTSSYVLVAGGYSSILLGVFDIWKFRTWAMPFAWIGTNAITIYIFDNLYGFGKIASRLVGGHVQDACGNWGPLLNAVVVIGLTLLFLNFLYRKKIFLRL